MSHPHSDTLAFKAIFKEAGLFRKSVLVLSSWFGAGLLPVAPGTFGTLAAVPLVFVKIRLGSFQELIFLLIFVLLAVWVSDLAQKTLRRGDPSEVVIDEAAGFLLTVFWLPCTWLTLIAGFVLFRAFDIFKPFPIRKLERIKGGPGIVLDDLAAGVYANLCVRLLLYVWPGPG